MTATSRPLHIALIGATGRMGSALVRLAHEQGHKVHVGIARGAAIPAGVRVTQSLDAIAGADVAIDFSAPELVAKLCDMCILHKIALVSGTTGLDNGGHAALTKAAAHVPLLWEPNMSLGVFVLGWLSAQATALLGPSFDVEVLEVHHRRKVDAPSGTALRLANAIQGVRSSLEMVHSRDGHPGARRCTELGMHAVRGGDVVGDHSVYFLGNNERLELTHRATTRDLFAAGALRAAEFVASKPAGRYGLGDVLGLNRSANGTTS